MIQIGIFEAIGFVFNLILIGIIIFFLRAAIPHDIKADFTAAKEWVSS